MKHQGNSEKNPQKKKINKIRTKKAEQGTKDKDKVLGSNFWIMKKKQQQQCSHCRLPNDTKISNYPTIQCSAKKGKIYFNLEFTVFVTNKITGLILELVQFSGKIP